MKNIVFTALHLQYGGTEKTICDLANAMAQLGYNVRILCIYNFGPTAYDLDAGVSVQYLTDMKPNREAFMTAVRQHNIGDILREGIYAQKVLRTKRKCMQKALNTLADSIVICSRKEHASMLAKNKQDGLFKILHLHYNPQTDHKFMRLFPSLAAQLDALVVLNKDFAVAMNKQLREASRKENVYAIGNSISLPATFYQHVTAEGRRNRIFYAGRLEYEKGADLLPLIWQRFLERTTVPAELVIIGKGSLKKSIVEQVRALNLDDSVSFHDYMSHGKLLSELQTGKALILPSRSEGFGLILIEAGACGLPQLSYDIAGGPQELIINDCNGYRCANEDEMADSLVRIISDENLWFSMYNEARKIAHRYEIDKTVPLWEALWQTRTE